MAQRVLVYTNHFFPENFKVNEVCNMLVAEGMEITVITGIPNYPDGKIPSSYGYFKRRRELVNGVKVKRLFLIPRGSGSKPRLVINYMSYFISSIFYTLFIALFKKKYDVVFVHHTSPIMVAITPILYKWLRQPKMILWDLDLWPDTLIALDIIKEGKLTRVLDKLVKWVYTHYDKILIGSQSFAEKAKVRVAASKVDYFPNWAEDVFTQDKQIIPASEPDFPKGFNIMYAGNIGEAQDFGSVFKTMELLRHENINWLIVGGGRWLKNLQDKITASGLEARVKFYGNHPLETMPYFFSKADVMFFSLLNKDIFSKTVPAKLQAYMAAGKTVVGMISGEGNTIIKDANCGICVNSGDYLGFSEAIKKLHAMQDNLEEIGQNGMEFYSKHFSKESRKVQLLDLINSTL